MLSHELRNPLAAISNAVQLLKLDPEGSAEQTTGIIERQVGSLVQLVNDLIDVRACEPEKSSSDSNVFP